MDSKDEAAKLAERQRAAKAASKRRHPAAVAAAQRALHMAGRCGSHDGDGHLCTKRAVEGRHAGDHEQQTIGGVNDGLVEWTWQW